jgi:3-hydroxyacyl-CoA dehydrogenase/3-hydroxy-2-methylbutyryl-CoA dehydrogenase
MLALVTGASSGLGAATAARLLKHGWRVALFDLPGSAERASAVAAGAPSRALWAPGDVTSEADVCRALDAMAGAWPDGSAGGAPAAVVQCAGIATAARTLDRAGAPHALAPFDAALRVNALGTFNVARLAAARMAAAPADARRGRGVLVHTASIAAFEGQGGQSAYAASKGAVAALTLPLARDLARHGIRVNCIAPGLFGTPMLAGLPEKARLALAAGVPCPQRLGDPDEYAQLAEAIIENQYINGTVIRIDGALRMQP